MYKQNVYLQKSQIKRKKNEQTQKCGTKFIKLYLFLYLSLSLSLWQATEKIYINFLFKFFFHFL